MGRVHDTGATQRRSDDQDGTIAGEAEMDEGKENCQEGCTKRAPLQDRMGGVRCRDRP